MAGEQVDALPNDLHEWVQERAEETDRPPAEVLARAIAAYRLLDDDEGDLERVAAEGVEADAFRGLSGTVADLDGRVEAVEDDFAEKVEDVRDRVVQVKRETDAKAPADHDHPDLRRAAETAEALADDVAAVRADLDDLGSTFEAGFANYEEVLEYLTDATDDLEGKADALAAVAADLRTRLGRVEAREARARAAADLKDEANELGVSKASCGACGSPVRLGLLSSPECPHCGGAFEAVEGSRGFFGSPTLTVGERPALEGETADEPDPEDIFEDA